VRPVQNDRTHTGGTGHGARGKLVIRKVNVDDHRDIAAQYGIRAIPTLLLFKGGQLADQYVGMMDKATLKSKLAAKL